MIRYLKLRGVSLEAANGLPTISITPEGKAMGSIPGWKMLLDPAYPAGTGLLNRARANDVLNTIDAALEPGDFGQFANGEIAYSMGNSITKRLPSTFAMNVDAWSAFFVLSIDRSGTASGGTELMRPEDRLSDGIGPRITVRTNGQFAIIGTRDSNIRLDTGGNSFPDDSVRVMMATFSVREGLRIFDNGKLVAENGNDRAPLDEQFTAGEFAFFRSRPSSGIESCLIGMTGILDIDLGWPEHAGYRRAIERFLMDKYGING